ncbi:hypothetical protein [Roseomonas sp. HF4]|uniref:hypothetical protein n=1 Tax=Roseomonas sp. HF4 TaxID=2562313 RepID=UPI0010C026C9|nr:hypothetical protein [Roseomonas sp. HF4]
MAAGLIGLASPAALAQFAAFDLVWVRPAAESGAPSPCARILVLDLPRDWMAGDAAAVVIADRADAAAAFPPLRAALLAERTAVLEFPSGAAEGCHVAPGPLAEVLGALRDLREDVGAGVVVAVGVGTAGAAVLDAAREEVAARFLGHAGARLAVAVAIGPDGTRTYARGTRPPAEEAWPERLPLLCAALAGAEGPAACMAALAPEGPRFVTARPLP